MIQPLNFILTHVRAEIGSESMFFVTLLLTRLFTQIYHFIGRTD